MVLERQVASAERVGGDHAEPGDVLAEPGLVREAVEGEGGELGVPVEEVGGGLVGDGVDAEADAALGGRHGGRQFGQVLEGGAAPEGERLGGEGEDGGRPSVEVGGAGLVDEGLEAAEVDEGRVEVEPVAAGFGADRVGEAGGDEPAAEPVHGDPDGGVADGPALPQLVLDAAGGDPVADEDAEEGERAGLASSTDVDGGLSLDEWASEDAHHWLSHVQPVRTPHTQHPSDACEQC